MNWYDEQRKLQYEEEDRLSKQADKINKALQGQLYQGESYILKHLKEKNNEAIYGSYTRQI